MVEFFSGLLLFLLGLAFGFLFFPMSWRIVRLEISSHLYWINNDIAYDIANGDEPNYLKYLEARKEFIECIAENDKIFKRLRGG